jgi:hypothetical protein
VNNRPRRSSNYGKTLVSGGPDPSWLIGDIKLSLKTLKNTNNGQWEAIMNYAARNGNNVAGFITLFGEGSNGQGYIQSITKKALTPRQGREGTFGVITLIATILPDQKSIF